MERTGRRGQQNKRVKSIKMRLIKLEIRYGSGEVCDAAHDIVASPAGVGTSV